MNHCANCTAVTAGQTLCGRCSRIEAAADKLEALMDLLNGVADGKIEIRETAKKQPGE